MAVGYNSVSGTFPEMQGGKVRFLRVEFTPASGEDPDTIMNLYYLARLERRPQLIVDAEEVSEVGWFGTDDEPAMGFPRHQPALFNAWRRLGRGETTLIPLPERGPSLD